MKRQLHTLGKWGIFLGGPLIWFAHFGIVYGAASLEITFRFEAGWPSRVFIALLTLGALAAVAWLGWSIWRGHLPKWETPWEDVSGLWRKTGGILYFLSFIAIVWQSLPALLVHGDPSHEAALGGRNVPMELP